MELFFRKLGEGPPLVILHGLFGSSDNWFTIGRQLSAHFTVYLVDQRNHGQSPHLPSHTFNDLAGDLKEFIDNRALQRCSIIGHSMGGKAALLFGNLHPHQVEKLVVVDISPFAYDRNGERLGQVSHALVIGAMQQLNLTELSTREQADTQLSLHIQSAPVRQFILKNLKRTEGGFEWVLNTEALALNLPAMYEGVTELNQTAPSFPLLFIRGARSGYLNDEHLSAIMHVYPHAQIVEIADAGHWVHAEKPAELLTHLIGFLLN